MSLLDPPQHVALARTPTPLQPLRRLSKALGVELLCKRDDLTGAALSGNKVRKLEFVFAQALSGPEGLGRPYSGVITCGGAQSNHARATAIAAAQLGLACRLLLRTKTPKRPPAPSGNLFLDHLVGATIRWITPAQYADRDRLMAEEAARAKAAGDGDYTIIPEGASNALGAWGYVRCVEELSHQIGNRSATVVTAVGSGGTAAGLIAGARLLQLPYRVIGICVCDNARYFQQRIAALLEQMEADYHVPVAVPPEAIELWDGYVGRGYALSRDEELASIAEAARLEGLITDPVYTGKALYGLLSELRRGRSLPQPIVFLHTGGIYGLFPAAPQMAPWLDPGGQQLKR